MTGEQKQKRSNEEPSGPGNFGLLHDQRGRLVLIDAEGRRHVDVKPLRSFPISEPTKWLSICDAQGIELAFVEDIDELPPQVRTVLDEDFVRRDFVPVITRIEGVSSESEPSEWSVLTDRGATRFTLANDDDVRRFGQGATVVDAHGTRYLVPDLNRLDESSRRQLDRYL
jgi:hypothetical protein